MRKLVTDIKSIIPLTIAFSLVMGLLGFSTAWSKDKPVKKPSIYNVDVEHSSVSFDVVHLGIASVKGGFDRFKGSLNFVDGALTEMTMEIDVNAINTKLKKRDDHLRSPDFFDVKKFKTIAFKATKIEKKDQELTIEGMLTIKGVSKPVVLKGTLYGFIYVKMWDVHKVGLTLSGKINRKLFGLTFDKKLPTGEAMVGEDVTLSLAISANMKK